jgi:hypothetical protein
MDDNADTTRAGRLAVLMDPRHIDRFSTEEGMWAETAEQREDRLERAYCRDILLDWVRERLHALSDAQREAVELHFFVGLTYEQAAFLSGKHKSTIKRNIDRAITFFIAEKRRDPSWRIYAEFYRFGQHPRRRRPHVRAESTPWG